MNARNRCQGGALLRWCPLWYSFWVVFQQRSAMYSFLHLIECCICMSTLIDSFGNLTGRLWCCCCPCALWGPALLWPSIFALNSCFLTLPPPPAALPTHVMRHCSSKNKKQICGLTRQWWRMMGMSGAEQRKTIITDCLPPFPIDEGSL